jgi:hypothetical protein
MAAGVSSAGRNFLACIVVADSALYVFDEADYSLQVYTIPALLLLAVASLLTCLVPAVRSAAVDPIVTLREE